MLANSANRLRMTVDYNFPKGGVTLPASNVNTTRLENLLTQANQCNYACWKTKPSGFQISHSLDSAKYQVAKQAPTIPPNIKLLDPD